MIPDQKDTKALVFPPAEGDRIVSARPEPVYHPMSCCACRWVCWNEDCGHGESDGIESPHDHCELHDGR